MIEVNLLRVPREHIGASRDVSAAWRELQLWLGGTDLDLHLIGIPPGGMDTFGRRCSASDLKESGVPSSLGGGSVDYRVYGPGSGCGSVVPTAAALARVDYPGMSTS